MSDNQDYSAGSARRNRNEAAGKCINGDHHGPPAPGLKRCAWCALVHRVGSAMALQLAAEDPSSPQPFPGYRSRQ